MSENQPRPDDATELPPPARLTRETMLGCVGLLCVLLMLPLLWLAVGSGPGWLRHGLPLLAFAVAIGGAALALRVPASLSARSNDPQRPLTHAGSAPSVERPATSGNRLSSVLAASLMIAAVVGFALELVHSGAAWGLALMLIAGALLLAQGALVSIRRLPAPALRWVRVSIYGARGRHSGPLIATGFVALCGAFFLALLDGYVWGSIGLALFVVVAVMLTPLARRLPPPRGPQRTIDSRAPQSNDSN